MIEVTVAHLGLDRTTNTPVVILREKEGARVLPIWIGPAEASAIAMELQGMKAQRPLTHDLLKQILVGLGTQRCFPRLIEHRMQGHAPIHEGAQYLSVDEESDDVFYFSPMPVGNRHAHTDIPLAGIAIEQALKAREQRHEQGCSLALRLTLQACNQTRR